MLSPNLGVDPVETYPQNRLFPWLEHCIVDDRRMAVRHSLLVVRLEHLLAGRKGLDVLRICIITRISDLSFTNIYAVELSVKDLDGGISYSEGQLTRTAVEPLLAKFCQSDFSFGN